MQGAYIFLIFVAIVALVVLFSNFHESKAPQKDTIEAGVDPVEARHFARLIFTSRFVKFHPRFSEEHILNEYVVLDLETTGLSPETDSIIEVAAVKVRNGVVIDTYTTMVNPQCQLSDSIVELTGITQEMVDQAPTMDSIAPTLHSFLENLPIVAHNARFDTDFLAMGFACAGVKYEAEYVDTVYVAKRAYPNMKNYRLATLIDKLKLSDHEQQHRAEDDALCTYRLYEKCKSVITMQEAIERKLEAERKAAALREEERRKKVAHADALAKAGAAHEEAGDIEKAIECYSESVAAGCPRIYAYERLAIIYRKQHRYDEEIQVCNAAIKMLSDTRRYDTKAQTKKEVFQSRIAVVEKKKQRTGAKQPVSNSDTK